ncbi:MAG: hypothetical protein NZO16_00455 [Deltaproteobacteria bacterium]|nr:hypothetical protein [Deltaproteobacteria bacterium]
MRGRYLFRTLNEIAQFQRSINLYLETVGSKERLKEDGIIGPKTRQLTLKVQKELNHKFKAMILEVWNSRSANC